MPNISRLSTPKIMSSLAIAAAAFLAPISAASASVVAHASTAPSAPTSVSFSATSGSPLSGTLTWSAPSSTGGSSITGYSVTSTPSGKTCSTNASTRSCAISGLTKGSSYTFSVIATNAIGNSVAGVSSSYKAPSEPSEPKDINEAPGTSSGSGNGGDKGDNENNGNSGPDGTQLTITWTTPDSDGGSSITGYTVYEQPDGKSCTATSGSTGCKITGLSKGKEHTFTVKARNAVGEGKESAPSKFTTTTAPGAPTGVTASFSSTSATISWTAPTNTGNDPITGYTVTSSPGNKTCTTTTAKSCSISGLTKGTSYTFSVTATNSTGTSAPASSAAGTTPNNPDAPTNVVVTTTNTNGQNNGIGNPHTNVTISWTAPANNGGSAITSYTVTSTPGGKTCTASNGATSCQITNLAKGTSYTFTVVATNVAGNSTGATSSTYVSTAVPQAPTGVTATLSGNKIVVSWTAPSDNGNDTITGYTVTSSPGNKTCTATSNTTCNITGVTVGTTYTFTVTATNSTGTSSPSSPSSATATYSAPSAPTNASASYSNGAITVSWRAPLGVVSSYNVISNNTIVASGVTGTSAQITTFSWNVAYTFTVVAINAAGTSSASSATNSVTPRDVPNAPTNVSASGANGRITTSWSASSARGASVTGYTVTLSPGGKTCQVLPNVLSCAISGLSNGTNYTASVVATSALGNSAAGTSAPVAFVAVPGSPASAAASYSAGTVSISWNVPSSNGGSAITGYNVYTSGNLLICSNISGTSCTWTGYTLGTTYNFYVTAINAVGESSRSNFTSTVRPLDAPSAPRNASVTSGNQSATISWSSPASNGGTVITRYSVTATPGGATCTTDASGTSCTIGNLTNGTNYRFAVTATNYSGLTSVAAAAGSATPAATTWRPTNPSFVINGNGNGTASWTAPGDFGGSTPTSYVVTVSPGNATFAVAYPATSTTVTGLSAGTAYSFTVAAINAAGTSPSSTSSNSITPSGPPAVPTISGTSAITIQPDYYGNYYGTMTVNVVAPSDWGFTTGSNVGNLNLDIESPTGTLYMGSTPVTRNSDGTLTYTSSFSFGPLPLYTTYTISASASNANGSSATVSTQLSSSGPILNASAQGSYNANAHTMTWGVIPSVNSESINYVLTVNGKQICSGKASEVTRCAQTGVYLTLAPAATPQTPIASVPFNVTQSVAGVRTGSNNYVMNLYYLNCGDGQIRCSNLVGSYYRVDNGNLVNMDLSGLDLRGAGFYSSNLTNVSLNADNALGIQFIGDNLTGLSSWGTDFTGSFWLNNNETNTRFVNASWLAADNKGISGTPYALCATSSSITPNWTQYPATSDLANEASSCFIYKGALIAAGVKIVNVDLSGLNVSGMNMSMSQFTGDNLTNASFSGTDLSNATLQGDIVTGANFSGTQWYHATATGLTGSAGVVTYGYRVVSGYLAGPNVVIAFSNLSGLDFSNLDLSGATFLNDDMRGANFTNDVFYQTFLGQVVLPGSGLTNPNLLTGANFTNADLSGVFGILASFSGQYVNSTLAISGSAPARVPNWMRYSNGQLIVN